MVRKNVCENLKEAFGVVIDDKLNHDLNGKEGVISAPESKIKVLVIIPTDEEVMIARDIVRLLDIK